MAALYMDNPTRLSELIAERRAAERNYIKCLQALKDTPNNEERMRDFVIARENLLGATIIQDMCFDALFNPINYDKERLA